VAGAGVDEEPVVGALAVGDEDVGPEAGDDGDAVDDAQGDGVVVAVAADADDVGRAVPAAARREVGAEVGEDAADVGAAEVVDGEGVDAAAGVDLDELRVVEVHDDVAEVARERRPPAVVDEVEDLGAGRAVEQQGVLLAVATLDDVGPVAGVPHERVVAVLAEERVGATVPVGGVLPVAAEEAVGVGAAGHAVVLGPAVERRRGEGAVRLVERERVAAGEAVHDDPRGVEDRRRAARDRDGPAVDEQVAADVAADGDVVGVVVAVDGQDAVGKRGRDGQADAPLERLDPRTVSHGDALRWLRAREPRGPYSGESAQGRGERHA
jgi:hypothetical protein